MVEFSHSRPTLVEFCINFVPKFEKWSFLTLKLFKFDQKWLFSLKKQQVLTEYAFFDQKIALQRAEFGPKRSNLIELVHGAQIRLNSKIKFDILNSKFRNSNEFERIRPSLVAAIYCISMKFKPIILSQVQSNIELIHKNLVRTECIRD